jgi:hypothetical protein
MANAPAAAARALAETDGEKVLSESVLDATEEISQPCLLCPLCRCHATCRGWSA